MHGAGNDFVVIDNRFYHFNEDRLSALAKTLCHRRLGIGADGLLALGAAEEQEEIDFRMRYFNADGSLGLMCGNGARVLSQFAYRSGIEKPMLTFDTSAGRYRAIVEEDPLIPVKLFMPAFQDYRPDVAIDLASREAAGRVDYMFTGTQHGVAFVSDLRGFDVAHWGNALRYDPVFDPHGINMNFVQVLDPGSPEHAAHLLIRTFEKGVEAETLACGTGALAAALIAHLQGKIQSTTVYLDPQGGRIEVGFRLEEGQITDIYQGGPTTTVFRGSLEL